MTALKVPARQCTAFLTAFKPYLWTRPRTKRVYAVEEDAQSRYLMLDAGAVCPSGASLSSLPDELQAMAKGADPDPNPNSNPDPDPDPNEPELTRTNPNPNPHPNPNHNPKEHGATLHEYPMQLSYDNFSTAEVLDRYQP